MNRFFCRCALASTLLAVPSLTAPVAAAPANLDHSLDAALGEALANGKTDEVARLLRSGADPNAKTADTNATPMLLLAAAAADLPELAKLLVDDGAALEATNSRGDSALVAAALSGNVQTLNYLIKAGAGLESNADHGLTPLMFAAATGHTEVVRALITAGAKVNARSQDGRTALIYSSRKTTAGQGNLTIAKLLVEAGADVSVPLGNGDTAREVAQKSGLTDIEAYLGTINDRDRALLDSVTQGDWPKIKAALASGANPRFAPVLLEDMFDDKGTSKTPAMWLRSDAPGFDAAVASQILALSDLEAHEMDEEEPGDTALTLAVLHGDETMVALLLKAGASPNTIALGLEMTPLMLAADKQFFPIVKMLIAAGANKDAKNSKGETVMNYSGDVKFNQIAKYLAALRPPAEAELPDLGDLLK